MKLNASSGVAFVLVAAAVIALAAILIILSLDLDPGDKGDMIYMVLMLEAAIMIPITILLRRGMPRR